MSIATEITRLQTAKADIKSAIEEKGVEVGDGLINTYAEKINEVYKVGYEDEYNAFWDNFQDYGERVIYPYAFYRPYWNDNNFKPKYDIQPTNAERMFYVCGITDLKKICENQGITIDFSKAVNADLLFHSSKITNVGTIDLSSVVSASLTFYKCYDLENIDKIVSNSNIAWQNGFLDAKKLKNVIFEGEIGKGAFTINSTTLLNKESIVSIINCLSDTTESLAAFFSKTAVNNAFETAEGLADGTTSQEWLNLIATKPNWTISLS